MVPLVQSVLVVPMVPKAHSVRSVLKVLLSEHGARLG